MEKNKRNTVSKYLSLILRHTPEEIGLVLDEQGWADVSELITKSALKGEVFSVSDLQEVVESSDKKRFAFSSDGTRIRANQGHSVEVDLQLAPAEPPAVLYHGTVSSFLDSILKQGLQKMERHHVHLSADELTAKKVGSRRGEAIILVVRSKAMWEDGFVFFLSDNGVWLTDHVPAVYINFPL